MKIGEITVIEVWEENGGELQTLKVCNTIKEAKEWKKFYFDKEKIMIVKTKIVFYNDNTFERINSVEI